MDPVVWGPVIAAVISALGTLLITSTTGIQKLIKTYFDNAAKRMVRTRFAHGVKRVAEFHRILEEFRVAPFVDRVLLFRGSNCGGIPDPKRPYNVRCFYGWSKDPLKHPEDTYNFNVAVDSHYMTKLLNILQNGVSVQITTAIPDTARLKSYYTSEGVVASVGYFLSMDDNEMIYISVASYKAEFTQPQLMQLSMIIDRARACLAADPDDPS